MGIHTAGAAPSAYGIAPQGGDKQGVNLLSGAQIRKRRFLYFLLYCFYELVTRD